MITRSPSPAAGAVFSEDQIYRYLLWREPREMGSSGTVLWCLLNPSTATELVLDPTLTRVDGFSRRWGFARWEVVNSFALRSTDPAGLHRIADPIGPDNDHVIAERIAAAALVVVGWGAFPLAGRRAHRLVELADGKPMHCLGITMAGWPRHPLYLASTTKLEPWTMPGTNKTNTAEMA